MNKKILLTGASGFVGQQLYDMNPTQFRCVIRCANSSGYSDTYKVNEINSKTDWSNAFDGISSVIHLAGLAHSHTFQHEEYHEVNFLGTLRLAQQASISGIKRFVFVSSIGVNGPSTFDIPFSNSSNPNPDNTYAQSKLDAEIGLKKIAAETSMELVIVRPPLVYGSKAPGNFGSLVSLVSKLPCLPFGLINNKRDFISVHNLAELLIICAKHPNAATHTFLASDNGPVSIKEFTNCIAQSLDKKVIQLPIPVYLMRLCGKLFGKSSMVEQLVGNLEVDSSDLKKILDWTPPYTMKESMAFLKQVK